MLRQALGIFTSAVAMLGLVTFAHAQEPIDVCWKPSGMPPDVNIFVMTEDVNGGTWELVHADEFYRRVKNKIVFRYNPNLGPESLSRFPEKMRPKGCTPAPPPQKKAAPKGKTPTRPRFQ